MHPPFSMVFATVLFGIGQGLFLALMTVQTYASVKLIPLEGGEFYGWGSAAALVFLGAGLFSSVFHLGHPERAWRAISQWRTSWLSREVIALPLLMLVIFIYGVIHLMGWDFNVFGEDALPQGKLTFIVGWLAVAVNFALFIATGMIYSAIRFIQEWRCAMTPINFILMGTASGFLAATGYAALMAPELMHFLGTWAIIIMIVSALGKAAHLWRNSRIKYKSNIQTAIGVRHTHVEQKAMGFMGGSFNTREFFSHKSPQFVRMVKLIFLVVGFVIPFLMLISSNNATVLFVALAIQFVGLVMERWHFFAGANHPQNLYYQTV